MTTVDLLVIGAGPTGLSLGVDLARRRISTLIVERGDGLLPGARGKGIQPRTLEVFDDLGVLDAVRAAGGRYPIGIIWRDGKRQGEHRMFDAVEPTEAEPYTGPWMVPQWRTQEILLERLRALGGAVAFGWELTALTQDADGVTASFASGSEVRALYVIGADGGRSTVRRLMGIGMTGETVDNNGILVADVRIPTLDRDFWHIFPPRDHEPGFMAICPLAGVEEFQLVAQFRDAAPLDQSLDGIRKVVAERSHLAPEAVTEVSWASDFRPRVALADRFREGRVFLAGDAAHVQSPAGGQGLNTSIQDAYNLGWKLDAVLRGNPDAALLDSYEEERRTIAADMLRLSTGVHRGEVRRGEATQQLGLGYRHSSLTVETRQGLADDALHAGDRAPDGRRGSVRLFNAFRGPHWTLVGVGTDARLPPLPIPVVRIPAYEAYGTGIFLVRPDGYVGWAGETASGLGRYMARFGLLDRYVAAPQ
jgi:2-polyprenyl-6-methoxyphenol hydroxylase-like FAD-dependent oxidoreductase